MLARPLTKEERSFHFINTVFMPGFTLWHKHSFRLQQGALYFSS
jgi:hypothetical protein